MSVYAGTIRGGFPERRFAAKLARERSLGPHALR
jgi:hypothetical protein